MVSLGNERDVEGVGCWGRFGWWWATADEMGVVVMMFGLFNFLTFDIIVFVE